MTRPEPIDVARALVAERFPEAVAAFLTGSVVTPMRTDTSDLDIVVVRTDGSVVFRESVIFQDWPVELFVHTAESLHIFRGREAQKRLATLDRMIAMGVPIAGDAALCDDLQVAAREYVERGPQDAPDVEFKRYYVTDLLDDLAGSRNESETLMIAHTLYRNTLELLLLGANAWAAGGKWLVRAADDIDATLTRDLDAALRELITLDNAQPLVDVVDRVLDRFGGRLWAGYYNEAKLD